MGTTISFPRPDGKNATGYFARAPKANAPGLVVVQEWWGLQDQIKGVADRFASAGFDVIAPDLYAGTVVPYHDAEAANKEMSSLNFLDATDETVRGAVQFLARNGAKVGITGFCMGGAITVLASARVPELACAVPFYGIPPESVAGPKDVKVPLQGHFANHDDYFTPEAVNAFEAGLKAAGKDAVIYRYDADHGFVNEQRMSAHNRQQAEIAFGRALAFLNQHLA